jgi:hypothetical protein
MFTGLNPSTATETEDDNTVRRCIGLAKSWGYQALCMANLFAFRSRHPRSLLNVVDPVGPDNDKWLVRCAKEADKIICAWGYFKQHKVRQASVFNMLSSMHRLYHLGMTKNGWPRHPLFIRKDVRPIPWMMEWERRIDES